MIKVVVSMYNKLQVGIKFKNTKKRKGNNRHNHRITVRLFNDFQITEFRCVKIIRC